MYGACVCVAHPMQFQARLVASHDAMPCQRTVIELSELGKAFGKAQAFRRDPSVAF
jgi:hypothetical protein